MSHKLPKEFVLSRYAGMEKCSARTWFELFEQRALIYGWMTSYYDFIYLDKSKKKPDSEQAKAWEKEYLTQILLQMFKNPLSQARSEAYITIEEKYGIALPIDCQCCDEYYLSFKPVHEFSTDQCYAIFRRGELESNGWNSSPQRVAMDVVREKWGMKTLDNGGYPICINPDFSDEELIDSLRELLPMIRSKLGIEQPRIAKKPLRVTYAELARWAELQLLPYLDIKLWTTLNKYEIYNTDLEKILYPGGEYTEDTIRKTLEPLSKGVFEFDRQLGKKKMIAKKTRSLLRSLIASDIEKNTFRKNF